MLKRSLSVALATLLAAPLLAHASAQTLAGTYDRSTKAIGVTVVVKPIDATRAMVSMDMGAPNCAGQITGEA